jgi:hypothetical protein
MVVIGLSIFRALWGGPHRAHPIDPPELNLGYMFLSEDIGGKIENGYVTLSITARLSTKSLPTSSLFIQEKDAGGTWRKAALPIDEISWNEYRITKKIRKEAVEIEFGLSFKPRSENDWIEIKNIKVAGWPSR